MGTANHFNMFTRADLDALINRRPGETKLGECVLTAASVEEMAGAAASFVLLGILEDTGVRANLGIGGAHTAWEPALKALLNVQSTEKLTGAELLVWGAFDFSQLPGTDPAADTETLRARTAAQDELVFPFIEAIVAAGKIPMVIGGGHNNAYPLIKGASRAKGRSIGCINLDAHSDYRMEEGRHSGNGFRYARTEGLLERYAIVGLHENYNAQTVVDILRKDSGIHFSFFEDIFLREKTDFQQAVKDAIVHVAGLPCGIELDMDSIGGVLSSAMTPSGISSLQARQYVYWCGMETEVLYLHLPEGATLLRDGRSDPSTGKLIAYLVTDFLKAVLTRRSV
jgi:formiminoglutamase